MADNVYIGNQRGTKFKADVVGGIAIPGFKLVVGDDNTDGDYVKSADGQLRVVPEPYTLKIGQGQIASHTAIRTHGTNDAAGAAFETVSEIQGLYSYLSAAEVLKVKSSSANDDGDPAGTGAQTLKIWGLDGSWDETSETITLNGTTAVATSNSYIRVNRVKVLTTGNTTTGVGNIGTITINDNADAVTLAKCMPSEGGNSDCIFSVPDGQTAVITKFRAAAVGTSDVTVHLMVRPFGGNFVTEYEISVLDSAVEVTFDTGIICSAKSDIAVWAQGAAANPFVSASFEGWHEDA
jgi:hypothetical protein